MTAFDALAQSLRALGVPAGQVPVDVAEAAALYRSRMAGRRLLLVLDNAASVEQVRPLLPGTPGCLVLATSREGLGGLVAREGAHRLALDVLPAVEAHALLTRVLGAERADAEVSAVADLARMCAYLPLALRIAAANLTDPTRGVADYVAELAAGNMLTGLEVDGDETATVRAPFELSYRSVSQDGQRLFRLLGLVPGPDFTIDAAAALTGAERELAARLLRALAAAHLVQRNRPDRYAFHDLLREYARERIGPDEAGPARIRLFEWYAYQADEAAQLLHPHILCPPVPASKSAASGPIMGDQQRALAWLRAEARNLVEACLAGGDLGVHQQTWQLSCVLRAYVMVHADRATAKSVCEAGLRSAIADDDERAQAVLHCGLANVNHSEGRSQEAIAHLRRALSLSRTAEWRHGEIQSRINFGVVCGEMGEGKRAVAHLSQAVRISREIGSGRGVASALTNLGTAQAGLGQLSRAEQTLRDAVNACHEHSAQTSRGAALDSLAGVVRDRGRLDEALVYLDIATALAVSSDNLYAQIASAAKMATVHALAGRYDQARRCAEKAVRCCEGFGARLRHADAANALGMAYAVGHRYHDALDSHGLALQLAGGTAGRQYIEALIGQATAYIGLDRWLDAQQSAAYAAKVASATGQRTLEGWALTELAQTHLGLGMSRAAEDYAKRALASHRATGYVIGEARTLVVLGDATVPADSRVHWRAASALLIDVGMYAEADLARARITD
jgi:tetratricopeptide (TPR) repeat protein